jgi:transcriptional regulator GlxA family with amidase domain
VLDYAGPFEVFSLTVYEDNEISKLLTKGLSTVEKPFIVKTISQTGQLISSHNGLKVQPDYSFQNVDPKFDILIVPGGPLYAAQKCIENKELIKCISNSHESGGIVASVCSSCNLISGSRSSIRQKSNHTFLGYWLFEVKVWGYGEVVPNVRYVDEGNILTSAAVSAGIDMPLNLIGKLMGKNTAIRTAATE